MRKARKSPNRCPLTARKVKSLTFCLLLLLPIPVNAAQEFKFVNTFGGKGAGEAQFAKTLFMAFGPDRAIYVTDTDNFRIQKFNETGAFAFDIQMKAESEFRFINPTGISRAILGTTRPRHPHQAQRARHRTLPPYLVCAHLFFVQCLSLG